MSESQCWHLKKQLSRKISKAGSPNAGLSLPKETVWGYTENDCCPPMSGVVPAHTQI